MAGKATGTFRRRVARTAGDGIGKLVRKGGRIWGLIWDSEEKILNPLRSPKKRLHFGIEVTLDGKISVRNTAEKESFRVFDMDALPWDYANPQKNYNLLVGLLNGQSLATIEVFSKPSKEAISSVRQDIESTIARSRERGLSTPSWEQDLRALADYIDQERTDHIRYGVYNAKDMEGDLSSVFSKAEVGLLETGYFIFGLLNGFWNEKFFKELIQKWGERREQARQNGTWTPEWDSQWMTQELTHYLVPGVIDRTNPSLPTIIGESGRLSPAAFEITSLGISTFKEDPEKEDSPEISLPNTGSWLSDILYREVEEVGDTIIVVSTYYSTGKKLSEPWQKRSEASYIPHALTKKEEKQFRADERASKKSEELRREVKPVQHLDQAERNYLTLWHVLLDEIANARELMVRVHYTVVVQAPDKARAETLAGNVEKLLTRKDVLFRRTSGQQDSLKALRTSLPVVLKDNTEEDVSPLSLDGALASVVPEEKRKVAVGALRIPIGVDKYGNLYYLPFEDAFGVFSRPRAGKSSLYIVFCRRADGLLPKWRKDEQGNEIPGSIFWYWDATNVIRPADPEPKFGLPLLAKQLNSHVDWSLFPEHLKDGVVYAKGEPYEGLARSQAAEQLKRELLMLCREAKARFILFRSHKEVLKKNGLDYGFLEAVDTWRSVLASHEVPSVFVADEAIASELALVEALIDHGRGSGKFSEALSIAGHSKEFLPKLPQNLRTEAQSLIPITIIGGTNLHRLLMEEADINPDLFRDEARKLARRIAAITIAKTPGHFMLIEGGGGGRIEEFYVVVEDPETGKLIRRKSEEAAREFGL